MNRSDNDRDILLKSQQGELDAVLMYQALAEVVKDTKDADTFRKLAAEEGHHAAVFHGLTNENLKPKKTLAILMPILYKIIGKKEALPAYRKGRIRSRRKLRAGCGKISRD